TARAVDGDAGLEVDDAAAAPPASAQARPRRRLADDRGLGGVAARANLGRHARAVDLAHDFRPDRAVDGAHRRIRLVAQPGAGAIPAAACPGKSGDAVRHHGDRLRARGDDRLHDLHAALLSGRAWA